MRVPICCLLLSVPLGAAAGDLLDAPACRAALQALSAAEAQATGEAAAGRGAELRARRHRAAVDCLGPAAAQAASQPRAATSPPPRSPVQGGSTAGPRASAVPAIRPLPVPRPMPQAPVAITQCDAAGCWASDGSRLQKQGPVLVGPRGPCTQTAGVLNCP